MSKLFDINERVNRCVVVENLYRKNPSNYHSHYFSAPNFISFRERVSTNPKTSPIVVIFVECLSRDFETVTFFRVFSFRPPTSTLHHFPRAIAFRKTSMFRYCRPLIGVDHKSPTTIFSQKIIYLVDKY